MAILEIICFLSSVILLIHASEACPVSRCGRNGSAIGFPFHLPGQHPQNCGYPGFDLTCRAPALTVLRLPSWGDFFVRGIDYITQEIRLYDPDDCLARRLLAFNLTASPFSAGYYRNYTLLVCAPELIRSRFNTIGCLSNSTSSVLATSSTSLVSKMSSCRVLAANLTLPVSWAVEDDQDFSSDLNSDLLLTWDVPNCGDCRAQGGSCRFLSNSSLDVGCFDAGNTIKITSVRYR